MAGTVLVPALMRRLTEAQADVETGRARLSRLTELGADSALDTDLESRLQAHYNEELESAEARLAEIEGEVETWRSDGPALIGDACAWIDGELEWLRARSEIEVEHDLANRIALLEAERRRLADVARFLDGDPAPPTSA